MTKQMRALQDSEVVIHDGFVVNQVLVPSVAYCSPTFVGMKDKA